MRTWGPVRNQFLVDAGSCWICGRSNSLTCHEMCRGSHREASLSKRITWLSACARCNCDELTDAAKWPLERQLAVKWIYDVDYFDIKGVCLIRGRQADAIVMAEVVPHICKLLDVR